MTLVGEIKALVRTHHHHVIRTCFCHAYLRSVRLTVYLDIIISMNVSHGASVSPSAALLQIQKEWRPLRDTRVEEELLASHTKEEARYTSKHTPFPLACVERS
jgi:hypothetical protein